MGAFYGFSVCSPCRHSCTQYAKDADEPNGIAIRITAFNRGPGPATLHILPQLWFPNTWSWPLPEPQRPCLGYVPAKGDAPQAIVARHETLGKTRLWCSTSPLPVSASGDCPPLEEGQPDGVVPDLLFTDNDTNFHRLYDGVNKSHYVKDAFHDHIIPSHRPPVHEDEDALPSKTSAQLGDNMSADICSGDITPTPHSRYPTPEPHHPQFVNPNRVGTKATAHYTFPNVPGNGGCIVVRLKLTPLSPANDKTIYDEDTFDDLMEERRSEADEFYGQLASVPISDDLRQITRQALGGMLWTKQFYKFIQTEWINGDPGQPPPPPERKAVRNRVRLPLRNLKLTELMLSDRNGSIFISLMSSACLTRSVSLLLVDELCSALLLVGISILCSCESASILQVHSYSKRLLVGHCIPLYPSCYGGSVFCEKAT